MPHQLSLKIILQAPPAGVDYALQSGSGSVYETLQKQRSNGSDLVFEGSITVTEGKDGQPDFKGKIVQGPVQGRFLYIDIGSAAVQKDTSWSRRLKIPLSGMDWPLVNKATTENLVLVTEVPGTGKDGGPNCATVKPFAGWKLQTSQPV